MSFEALSDWSAALSLPSSLSTRWQRSRWRWVAGCSAALDRSARSRTTRRDRHAAGERGDGARALGSRQGRVYRRVPRPAMAPVSRTGRPGAGAPAIRVLLALLLAVNGIGLVKTIAENLGPVFAGPGLPLLLSSAFAAALLGPRGGEWPRRWPGPRQWLPTAGAVLTFVLAGRLSRARARRRSSLRVRRCSAEAIRRWRR